MKCKVSNKSALILGLAAAFLAGCSNMQMGAESAKTTATGSAGGSNAQGENAGLEKCDQALGTMAVVEDLNSDWYRMLSGTYKLGPTAPVLKLLAQQSNCFVVVERGRAMDNMMTERALQNSGELRKKSNFGKGQMVSADYSLNPSITFSNNNAGGAAGGLGGAIGGWGGTLVRLAGSANVKEASTLLTLIDNRSGVQLAAAEGSAKNTDFGAMGAIFGSSAGGNLGGYSNTAEGKVIVAALTDSFNNIVRAVRNYKMQTVKGGLGTGKGGLQVQQDDDAQPAATTKKKTTRSRSSTSQ